jgi:U3 small nucleolar RNA-associated protein 6
MRSSVRAPPSLAGADLAALPVPYRGDLALWARWLRYCTESGASRQVSKVVTQALQYHPTAPGLWTFAAAWEFEHNLNAASARSLMQQALRMCKHAEVLWHEYYRMELLYALRLRERRRTLGIENARADAGECTRAPRACAGAGYVP